MDEMDKFGAEIKAATFRSGDEIIDSQYGWGVIQSGNDVDGYMVGFGDILAPDEFPVHQILRDVKCLSLNDPLTNALLQGNYKAVQQMFDGLRAEAAYFQALNAGMESLAVMVRGIVQKHMPYVEEESMVGTQLAAAIDTHIQEMAARIEQLSKEVNATEQYKTTAQEVVIDTADDLKMRYHDLRQATADQDEGFPEYIAWLEEQVIQHQTHSAELMIGLRSLDNRATKAFRRLDDLLHDMGVFAECGLSMSKDDKESLRSDDSIPFMETWQQEHDKLLNTEFHLRETTRLLEKHIRQTVYWVSKFKQRRSLISGLEDTAVDLGKLVEKRNRQVRYWMGVVGVQKAQLMAANEWIGFRERMVAHQRQERNHET